MPLVYEIPESGVVLTCGSLINNHKFLHHHLVDELIELDAYRNSKIINIYDGRSNVQLATSKSASQTILNFSVNRFGDFKNVAKALHYCNSISFDVICLSLSSPLTQEVLVEIIRLSQSKLIILSVQQFSIDNAFFELKSNNISVQLNKEFYKQLKLALCSFKNTKLVNNAFDLKVIQFNRAYRNNVKQAMTNQSLFESVDLHIQGELVA